MKWVNRYDGGPHVLPVKQYLDEHYQEKISLDFAKCEKAMKRLFFRVLFLF